MTRLALLLLLAALVVPGTASAMPAPDSRQATPAPVNARGTDVAADFTARGGETANVRASKEYFSSYGAPAPIETSAPAPAPIESRAGPSWFGALGIGLGLVLFAGGLGIFAGRSIRPRHIGV
jgi:hypothetical protein